MTLQITRLRHLATIFTIILTTGCASWSWLSTSGTEPAQRVAGVLERSGDTWGLKVCGQAASLPVQGTAELVDIFSSVAQPGQLSVFVELRATRENGRWQPEEVLRMQATGNGCDDSSVAGTQWVGFGTDPLWRADVSPAGLLLSVEDAEDGLQLPLIAEQLPDGSHNFRGLQDRGLELWLYPESCTDQATGDYYHLTATLIRDGQRLRGCGYQAG